MCPPAPPPGNRQHSRSSRARFAPSARLLCVAPMMGCTDRHERYFLRLLSPHSLLYTEMVTTGALLHGDTRRLLAHEPAEHPLALQLGGSDPHALAACARLAQQAGYDEVNLNCGCPSARVSAGRFGACLMAEPGLVAECVAAMRAAVSIPVTVKTRIGIDHQDGYDALFAFARALSAAGTSALVVHARKAWLTGLNPRQNREIPPLRHDLVHRLARDLRGLPVVVNGGITDIDQVCTHLAHVDGVMLGRAAYHDPWRLAEMDTALFGAGAGPATRHEAVMRFLPYVRARLADGVRLAGITRHLLGLFQGLPGARAWRRHLSTHAPRPGSDARVLEDALSLVPPPSVPCESVPRAALGA